MPFLGDNEPVSLCVTGGLVRGLHPSELSTATRVRDALDQRGIEENLAAVPACELDYDLRGFRFIAGGLETAVTAALGLARQDGSQAPLLLLLQGYPSLPEVLAPYTTREHADSGGRVLQGDDESALHPSLRDLVIVLGDDRGISEEEVERVKHIGAEVGGGGPVLCASLGTGCLLASQCIVIANHYLDAIHDCPSQLWQPSLDAKKRGRQRRKKASRRHSGKMSISGWSSSSSEDDDASASELSSKRTD